MKTLFILAALTVPSVARAEPASTAFYASVAYGKEKPRQVTAAGPVLMPSELSEWSCLITDPHVTDDGILVYRNISCYDSATSTMVNSTAACRVDAASTDDGQFTLRKMTPPGQPDVVVTLTISCVTTAKNTASDKALRDGKVRL